MRTTWVALSALLIPLIAASAWGQEPPDGPPEEDLGEIFRPVDEALGQALPPVIGAASNATGQNLTKEDVRIFLDLNVTKGEVGIAGLILGSGKAEVQATVNLRFEMRVISTDRIRAALEGENAYNASAENATFMSELYMPAEAFRATLSAETIAAFQADQEKAVADFLTETVPELEVLGLELAWKNTEPHKAITDFSLSEPPLVLEMDAVVQYLRVESVPSLLSQYLGAARLPDDPEKAYLKQLKEEHSPPLQSRNFFSAAAYTQLLNLTMQPGWLLDVDLAVPRGFSFEFANEEVERHSERAISFEVDAQDVDSEDQTIVLTSITHRRAVALALFTSLWVIGLVAAFPVRFVYVRYFLPERFVRK